MHALMDAAVNAEGLIALATRKTQEIGIYLGVAMGVVAVALFLVSMFSRKGFVGVLGVVAVVVSVFFFAYGGAKDTSDMIREEITSAPSTVLVVGRPEAL